ncbi:MAG: methyltransferase domain-containing protein, partial [Arcobacteraceae bacterium]|nr:methyltransferase domain-containing protein [Arcobacteraceae bacterium]
SRYAFRRHFPQHAGFRYVQVASTYNQLQEQKAHIFKDEEDAFFKDDAQTVFAYNKPFKHNSALNLGCYYGTASFLLAQEYKNVTGIDFTARNILNAQNQKEEQKIKNCQFWQGDSCNLKPHFKGYDLILVTNDFNELYCVETFLNELPKRLNSDGILVLQGRNIKDISAVKNHLNALLTNIGEFAWKK